MLELKARVYIEADHVFEAGPDELYDPETGVTVAYIDVPNMAPGDLLCLDVNALVLGR